DGNQFDQIYHEHFSYFSFTTANRFMTAHGLTVFDIEELSTHGGSIRVYARHTEDLSHPIGSRVNEMLVREENAGYNRMECYSAFQEQVKETKRKLLEFLIQ